MGFEHNNFTVKPIILSDKAKEEAHNLIGKFKIYADGEYGSKKEMKSAKMNAIICANEIRANCGLSFFSTDGTPSGEMIPEQSYWMMVIEEIKKFNTI